MITPSTMTIFLSSSSYYYQMIIITPHYTAIKMIVHLSYYNVKNDIRTH